MRRFPTPFLLLLALPVLALPVLAQPAQAELTTSALGNAGELHRVRAGAAGDLLPGDGSVSSETPVLVLEIAPAGSEIARLLVPGTEDERVESQARLLYEPRAGSTILIWQSAGPDGLRLDFATRGEAGWSEVHSLAGEDGTAVGLTEEPLVAVTRDAFDLTLEDGTALEATRSVIHLLYRPATGSVRYAPLIFVAGAWVGWTESRDLGDAYFQGGEEDPGFELTADLERALSLQVAKGDRSVIAAFANPASGRLGAVEIGLRPLALELLGDRVREEIYAQAELYDPDDISTFADKIRAELIVIGYRLDLHPGIVELTAGQVGDWIEDAAPDYGLDGFPELGDDARALAIYLAGSVSATVVDDPATGEEILELDFGELLDRLDGSPLAEILDIEVRSDRPAPEVGDGVAAIFPSASGRDLLVGWKADDDPTIHYVESRGDREDGRWSAPRTLAISEEIDLLQAVELLQRKIR